MSHTKNIFSAIIIAAGLFTGCSKPGPIIKIRVLPAHAQGIESSFLVRAEEAKNEWKAAKKQHEYELKIEPLRKLDLAQARAWVKAAQIQVQRAAFANNHKNLTEDVDHPKALDKAKKELELAQLYLEYRETIMENYDLLVDMYKWKGYAFQAQSIEETVIAIHKASSPNSAIYSKIKFMDQTYSIRRRFLILEEKYTAVAKKLAALRKKIEGRWDSCYQKNDVITPEKKCPACPPCPEKTCPECPKENPSDAKDGSTPDSKENSGSDGGTEPSKAPKTDGGKPDAKPNVAKPEEKKPVTPAKPATPKAPGK
ncbi:hypothetical protein KKF34_09675 [Myxococcota bacterium]|nr:hypothetical protein [Myxococcota bacterium]MBU1380548.1 hypothetical protein [Myxococcota bacterium]MBU1497133.1 hypothetical protein [Myxococcota bacterium]